MTNEQLYLAIGVPLIFNAILTGILVAYVNARLDGVSSRFEGRSDGLISRFEGRFEGINARFDGIDTKLEAINRRFDDMRDLWRAELHRVEEVLDARLKHLESR